MQPDLTKLRQSLNRLENQRAKGLRSVNLFAELGRHYTALGQYPQAEKAWREALAMSPGDARIALSLAEIMMSQRYFLQALHLLQQVVKVAPSADCHALIGVCLTKLDRFAQAEVAFRKSLNLDADQLTANTYLANLLWDLSHKDESSKLLQRALARHPDYPPAMMLQAKILREEHFPAESLPILRKLMAMPQYQALAASLYANACIDLGEFEEAEKVLHGLRENPATKAKALFLLTTIGKRKEDPEFEAEMKGLLARPDLVPQDRTDLLYGYSKYCDDTGRHGEAIEYGREAKKLENKAFDIEIYRGFVDRHIALITQERMAKVPEPAHKPDAEFCFVVGMPRSGTTLTEQTIAKLPGGVSLGEQDYFRAVSRRLGIKGDTTEYIERTLSLSPQERGEIAAGFLEHARKFGEGRLYVDKMPHNFEVLHLIRLCLPEAKFVWCQRNPVDTCISIFLNRFSDTHSYAGDLTTLGLYYREYERLMAHWQGLPATHSFPVHYETFVSDGGVLKGELLEFMMPGAKADESKTATVRTFSRWQARQPVYQSSVERWRRYEGHIDDLLAALHWPRD